MPSHRKFPLSTVLNFQRVCTGEPREPSELQCSCLAHLLDLSLQLPCGNSMHATPIALLAECLRTAFPCLSWYWHQSQQATPTPSLFRCEFRFIHFIKKVGFFLVQETIRITHPLNHLPQWGRNTQNSLVTLSRLYVNVMSISYRNVEAQEAPIRPCPHISGQCQPALRIYTLCLPLVTGHRFPLSPAWSYGVSQLHQGTASKVWAP